MTGGVAGGVRAVAVALLYIAEYGVKLVFARWPLGLKNARRAE